MISREALDRLKSDGGAIAVVVAGLMVILLVVTALALDVGRLMYERQKLKNTLDAAAQAGSYELPSNVTTARAKALEFATANDPNSHPSVTFYCVVGSTGATRQVPANAVGSTCYPGAAPYDSGNYPGLLCSTTVCKIPCPKVGVTSGYSCNAITVSENRSVPFYFAPIIGLFNGMTGTTVSSNCKGACGTPPTNPMDVVVVADRTGSMSAYLSDLKNAIKSMLTYMTPSVQYVALASINKSGSACPTGSWVSVPFSDNYNIPGSSTKPYPLNAGSALVNALTCMTTSSPTYLASPLKAAARYLLGIDPNNIDSLQPRSGTVTRAIIFETDGQPTEATTGGVADLVTPGDVSNTDGQIACSNLSSIASLAKLEKVLLISVAFGDANTAYCGTYRVTDRRGKKTTYYDTTTARVRDVLAGIASNSPRGGASIAETCTGPVDTTSSPVSNLPTCTAADILAENNDGDFFYIAATGTDLAPLFITALGQLNSHSRFMALP